MRPRGSPPRRRRAPPRAAGPAVRLWTAIRGIGGRGAAGHSWMCSSWARGAGRCYALTYRAVVGKYVALLRGINVGGRAKVSMSALRDLFAEMGYAGAKTYIQSGNVVFSA